MPCKHVHHNLFAIGVYNVLFFPLLYETQLKVCILLRTTNKTRICVSNPVKMVIHIYILTEVIPKTW